MPRAVVPTGSSGRAYAYYTWAAFGHYACRGAGTVGGEPAQAGTVAAIGPPPASSVHASPTGEVPAGTSLTEKTRRAGRAAAITTS
jgi:hypothetical protein